MGDEGRFRIGGRLIHWVRGGYRGRRRLATGRGAISPRVVLVGLAVGAVLGGGGALAATLPGPPLSLPAPAPAPPPASSPSQPEAESQPAAVPPRRTPPPPPTAPAATPPATAGSAALGSASPEPSRTPVTLSFEAENAELSGFVRIFPVPDASDGEVVGLIGLHRDSHVRFTRITVDVAGEYELTLCYISPQDREGVVWVNDEEPVEIEFPGLGSGRELGEVTVPLELVAGENELRFGNPDGNAPSLDRIMVAG